MKIGIGILGLVAKFNNICISSANKKIENTKKDQKNP